MRDNNMGGLRPGTFGNRLHRAGAWALFVVFLGLVSTGCGGSERSEPAICATIRADLDDAQLDLQSGSYDLGEARLSRGLDDEQWKSGIDTCATYADLVPRNAHLMSEAQFMLFMSRSLGWFDNLVTQMIPIVELILGQLAGTGAPAVIGRDAAFQALASSGVVEGMLESMLIKFRNEVLSPNNDALNEIAKDRGFHMKFSTLLVQFGGIDVVDIGGEYDLGEIYMMRAMNNFMLGTIDGIVAIESNVNIADLALGPPDLLNYVSTKMDELKLVPEDQKTAETIRLALNIVGVVMHNSDPTLFSVDDVQSMQTGAKETGAAFADFRKAVEHMRQDVKTDKIQKDDIFGYGQTDGLETIEVHFKPKFEIGIVNVSELQDLEIQLPDGFMVSVERIEQAFNGTGAGTIGWASDIVPIIALGVVTILKSGAFTGLIETLLGQGDLPEETVASILNLLHSEFLDANLIGGMMTELVPDVFQLNIKKYVYETAKPSGPRAWIPLWTTPVSEPGVYGGDTTVTVTIFDAYAQIRLVYEYECETNAATGAPDPISDGTFLCGKSMDTEHFASDYWLTQFTRPSFAETHIRDDIRIAGLCEERTDAPGVCTREGYDSDYGFRLDGLESPIPYLVVGDPSAGGLFELNFDQRRSKVEPMGDYYVTGWQPANVYSFNAFLAVIASQLTGLLGK